MSDNEKFKRLFEFCVKGDRIGLADYIITNGCNPSAYDAHDSLGRTALHIACQHGHLFTVRSLIEVFSCYRFVRDNAGNLPVHYACLHGHLPIVDYLLHFKGESITNAVFETDSEGNNLLHKACQSGSTPVVRYLQEILCYNSKDLVSRNLNLYCDSVAAYSMSLPKKICHHTRLVVLGVLTKNKRGDTPLNVASRHGHLSVVKIFKSYIPFLKQLKLALTATKCNHIHTAKYIMNLYPQLVDVDSESLIGQKESSYNTLEPLEEILFERCEKISHFGSEIVHKSIKCVECSSSFTTNEILRPFPINNILDALHEQKRTNERKWSISCPVCSEKRAKNVYHFVCPECNVSSQSSSLLQYQCGRCSVEMNLSTDLDANNFVLKNFNDAQVGFSPLYVNCLQATVLFGNVLAFKEIQATHNVPFDVTILHAACVSDNVTLVSYIMEVLNCGPNVLDSQGNTPLHVSCEWGSYNAFLYLLKHDDLRRDILNFKNESPLLLACKYDRYDICERLLDSTTTTAVADQDTPMHLACSNNNMNLVIKFVDGDVSSLNAVGQYGDTPIFNACRSGNLEMVQYLIKKGSDPIFVNDSTKESPVHIACRMGRHDILQVLLAKLPNNIMFGVNSYGATPIQLAIESGYQKTIEVLLNSCDNEVFNNIHNENQQTLAHLVSLAGQTHVAEYLVKHSVNWNAQDIGGNTPLHLACNKNNVEIVKLIAGHCTVTIQNTKLDTPVHITIHNGNVVILDALLEGYSGSLDQFKDLHGNTALHLACQNNNDSSYYIVKKLCDYCSVTVENKEKSTPMHFACKFGNLPLVDHLFKRYSSLHLDCLLVDDYENTILHVAVENSASLEVVTVVSKHISPVHKNKQGETPIHIACRNGDLPIVRLLVTKAAELVLTNSDDSYLHSACCGKSLEVVRFLVEESGLSFDRLMNTNNDGNTPLHCACITGVFEIISYLMRYAKMNAYIQKFNKEELTSFCCLLASGHFTIAKQILSDELIDKCKLCPPKYPLLHCVFKYLKDLTLVFRLVQFIVKKRISDPLKCDSKGNTILHCFLYQINLLRVPVHYSQGLEMLLYECWDYIIAIPGVHICTQNQQGDTPLHILVLLIRPFTTMRIFSPVSNMMKKYLDLLTNVSDIVNLKNKNGKTAIQLADRSNTYLLIKYGANLDDVSALYSHILNRFKRENPLEPSIKIVVLGNSKAGKSTLIETIKRQDLSTASQHNCTHVDGSTAGVKSTDHTSNVFGRVTFHDFGGQPEFESGNAVFLRTSVSIDYPPIFLLLVDVSQDFVKSALYWFSYIKDNTPVQLETPPHVIILGSHSDCISVSDQEKVKKLIMRSVGSGKSKLNVADPIILDCRAVGSEEVKVLSQVLTDSSTQLRRLLEIDCRCHILISHLSRWFGDHPAVKFKELQNKIKFESESSNYYQELLLPSTSRDLLALLKCLNSAGHLILLNTNDIDSCWIILDKHVLFEVVNGTLFAPPNDDSFDHVTKVPTNTGVLTSSILKSLFQSSEIDHIIAYIIYTEFCQKIEDPETVGLIEAACSSSTKSARQIECNENQSLSSFEVSRQEIVQFQTFSTDVTKEEYFFFPGLVRCERPDDVWSDDENSLHTFTWYMKCHMYHFLNPRFLHVLLLRLTFDFVTQSNSEPLQRKCNIWKNGIHWSTRSGVEVLVEVVQQNTAVVLLLRFIDGHELKGIELRSKIIEKILHTKEEFCPSSEVMEFVIPQCLSYPTNFCDVQKVFIGEIAQAMFEGNPCAFDSSHKSHKLKSILHYDSYLQFDHSLIKCVWSNDDDQTEVPYEQLSKLTKMQKMGVLGHELVKLIEGQEKVSYRKLREILGSFSIFCDRNPLKLATAKHPEMYKESRWQPNVNAPSSSVVTKRLQDHNIGAGNPLPSLPPHSTVSQDSQITNVIIPTVTETIGSSVGHLVSLPTSAPTTYSTSGPCKVTVDGLKKKFNISDDQLGNRIEKSDIKNLDHIFGDVELYLPGLGLCEADEADVRIAVLLHGSQTGMNKALTIWINSYNATFKDLISIALDVRKAIVAENICKYLQENNCSEFSLRSSPPPPKRLRHDPDMR